MKTSGVSSKKLPLAIQMALAVAIGSVAPMGIAQNAATGGQGDQPQTLQRVVVTGSRIRQVDLQNQQPVVTIDRQQIQSTGLTSVTDVIAQFPSIQDTGRRRATQSTTAGGSFANMRGLGSSRVLVLLDGHRLVTNSGGSVDLSMVPSSVIERVEVLKDGASAIYGSDAVAGVINIISRKNFDGLEARANIGTTDKGDGSSQQYEVTMGWGGDKGSLMLDLNYTKHDAIWNKTRAFTSEGNGPRHPGTSNYLVSARGQFTDSNGTFVLNERGLDTMDLANYHQIDPSHVPLADTYDRMLAKPFQTPEEVKSVYLQGRYDFTQNLSYYATAIYTERHASNALGAFPLQSHFFRLSDGKLSKDSIYNPTGEDVSIGLAYENRSRHMIGMAREEQLISGLRGSFSIADHFWDWDVGVDFGKITNNNVSQNNLNYWYMQRAMGPSFIDADGNPQCGTPGNVLDDCIPLNILGGIEALNATPALYDKVFITSQEDSGNKDMSYEANITGGLFDIPIGGEVGVAAGVQHRKLSGYNLPDAFTQSGLSSQNAQAGSSGSYTVNSAYLEVAIPLLKDLPGVKSLSFDLASRYSHYSNFGSTTNSKIGFEYRPIDDLMIRGNYAEAFRAPTISDISGGISEGFGNFTDPCDAVFGVAVYGDAVHSTCVAQLGAAGYPNPAQFRQQNVTGGAINAANQQSKNGFFSGPAPDLGPETAKTKTLGVVYSPGYLPGLGITLDWYQVKLDQIIRSVTANDVLQGCYQGNQAFCGRFVRDADGQVDALFTGLANRGTESLEGFDLSVTYTFPETSIGTFRINSDNTYMTKWEAKESPDAKVEQRAGWAISAGSSYWRVRSNTSLSWRNGPFGATWRVRYYSSLREPCSWGKTTECSMPDHIDPFHGVFPINRVGAVAFSDVSFQWDAPWSAHITVGANNIFDRQPPIIYVRPASSPPVNVNYPIDRFWFINYMQKF